MAQIQFKGKSIVWNHHLGVEYHELVPHKDKSLTQNLNINDNLIIQGDNLKALKALLPTYASKVKCIYIDPPYNTGNEGWAYSDNVSSPMIKDWLGKTVDREDLTRHDKWLAMMTPRLKLLRELLSNDGAIFVSIDDNEQHHLRMLMDEIFGEENFIAEIIWKKKQGGGNDSSNFVTEHEYVIVYSKIFENFKLNLDKNHKLDDALYPFNDESGDYGLVTLDKSSIRQSNSLIFTITGPDGKKYNPRIVNGKQICWRWSKEKVESEYDRLVFKNGKVYTKYYRPEGVTPKTLLTDSRFGRTETGNEILRTILTGADFTYPKPPELIKHLLSIYTDKDSVILDSFAGSGTTAQAVLELNKEDGGNRKFILVEMEDYADKITAERIRRVIRGVPNSKNENLKNGLGDSFSYFTLGQAIDEAGLLSGKNLPSYNQMARYLFYTATGEEFNETKVDEPKNYIGSSSDYEIYLLYKPDLNYLKSTALNLSFAESLPPSNKRQLIFAPAKYLDADHLAKFNIVFAQLPYEIYQKAVSNGR